MSPQHTPAGEGSRDVAGGEPSSQSSGRGAASFPLAIPLIAWSIRRDATHGRLCLYVCLTIVIGGKMGIIRNPLTACRIKGKKTLHVEVFCHE